MIVTNLDGYHADTARIGATLHQGAVVLHWTRDTLPTVDPSEMDSTTEEAWMNLAKARQAAARARRPKLRGVAPRPAHTRPAPVELDTERLPIDPFTPRAEDGEYEPWIAYPTHVSGLGHQEDRTSHRWGSGRTEQAAIDNARARR